MTRDARTRGNTGRWRIGALVAIGLVALALALLVFGRGGRPDDGPRVGPGAPSSPSASVFVEPGATSPSATGTTTPSASATGSANGSQPATTEPAGPSPSITPGEPTPSATDGSGDVGVLVGAGDVSTCKNDNDEKTARLVERIEGTVFVAGDVVYEDGTPEEFRECYDPTWGRFRDRTRPVPGNHEYHVEGGAGYHDYFGGAAGEPGKGWYVYELGAWRIYALNSNCSAIGGCGPDAPQTTWLREDLAAHPRRCVLAIWHHARWGTGRHGDADFMDDIWNTLYDAGAELVLSGHEHNYQRFAPLDRRGRIDRERGLRQITVGTGGRAHEKFRTRRATTEARNDDTYGVLKVELRRGRYDFEFIPVEGKEFTDSGSGECH